MTEPTNQEAIAEIWRLFKETDAKFKETDARLDIVEEAGRYAYRRGLFVLNVSGAGMVQLMNDQKFKPRNFAA